MLGCVDRADDRGLFWDDLGEARRARGEVVDQCLELVQVPAQVPRDPHSVSVGVGDAELKGAEQAAAAGDAQRHEAELAQVLLPLSESHAFAVSQVVEDGAEPGEAAFRELQGAGDRVQDPPEDLLAGGPGSVTAPELLLRDRLLALVVVGPGRREH